MKKFFLFRATALSAGITLSLLSCPVAQAETIAPSARPGSSVSAPLTATMTGDPTEEAFASENNSPPLTLEDCYKLALIQSEVVAIQKEAIARATAQMFTATSQALGDVNFLITRQNQDITQVESGGSLGGSFIDPARSERMFTISQPLFQGFKAIGALTGAGSYKREQKEAWIRAKELLYQDVAFAFYNVLRFKKELRINRQIHKLLEDRIRELEERERIGRSRLSEVVTARTGLKALEANLAGIKGSYSTAQFLLEFLTGTSIVGKKLEDQDSEDPGSKTLEDYLILASERSDVKAAEQAVKTSKSGLVVAQSGFWPTISMNHTQYMRREGFNNKVDWDLLFTVDVPLFSGTATVGQVKDSWGIFKQKKLSLSLAKRQATMEVKQSYEGWRFSRERCLAMNEAVTLAEEDYQLQSDEYRRNLVSNLDVLTSLKTLNETSRDANQAFYQMKQDEARLKVATGEVS